MKAEGVEEDAMMSETSPSKRTCANSETLSTGERGEYLCASCERTFRLKRRPRTLQPVCSNRCRAEQSAQRRLARLDMAFAAFREAIMAEMYPTRRGRTERSDPQAPTASPPQAAGD